MSAIAAVGPALPAGFHELALTRVDAVADDALAVTFAVPAALLEEYSWSPGQHVAVLVLGDVARRSYSLCPSPPGTLRIGVRRLPGGRFSDALLPRLGPGDRLAVMPPAGRFGAGLRGCRRPVFVAGGSGVTPMLSLVSAALAEPDVEQVALVVANRSQSGVMFADEIADLKDRSPERLQVVHVLSREVQESPLLSGRLDGDRFRQVRARLLGAAVDGWFLCGPHGLVRGVRDTLLADGVPAGAVHVELFHADPAAGLGPRRAAPPATGTAARVRLGGRLSQVHVAAGETLLDAVLRVRGDAPYACRGGVCGTCRARVEGEVVMDATWALEPDELDRGYALTCQARPTGERLEVDYDA